MAVTFSSSVNLQGAMQIGMATFTPAALFSTGEQGAWYDPSDNTTMWQKANSTGTIAVTGVEQAVGLILDKSKSLALGSELVTNGDFSGGTTGWTPNNATLAVSSGELTVTTTVAYGAAKQDFTTTAGKWYKVSAYVRSGTDPGLVQIKNGATVIVNTASGTGGTVESYFLSPATTLTVFLVVDSASVGKTAIFDNVSIKEVAGNHAYQSTDASRPILRSRYNLLTYSEQFDNAAWTKTRTDITQNDAVAPDGTTTADKIVANATHPSASGLVYQSATITSGATVAGSVYFKAGNATWAFLRVDDNANVNLANIWFDIATGAVGTTSTSGSGFTVTNGTVQSVGNGWYRCSAIFTTASVTTIRLFIYGSVNANGSTASTLGNFAYIWGAQLTQTAVFPSNTYQRIAASTDYATGAAFPQYLSFDGTDDSLLTASVDFTGTDKMTVWSGVTKQSDAAAGALAELGPPTSPGYFLLDAPGTAAANYFWRSHGNLTADILASTFTAPITNVLTGIADISADNSVLRANGLQVGSSTNDQGTGNYGNYPLYIGRRNNSTLPFNGRIYSLIVRGAATLSSEVASTEQWVAAKTPLGSL